MTPSVLLAESVPRMPVPTTATPEAESAYIRGLVVEAVRAAAEVIADPVTAERWNEPSALAGMTVGALAAHLVRASGATIAYLDRTDSARIPEGELLTPVTYFHAAIDSPIHEQIKVVSADEATVGSVAVAEKCALLVTTLTERFEVEPVDRLVGALGGRMLRLDDFCRTRLIEVLLHLDDLVASVGVERPHTDPAGPAIVIDILMGIARNQHGDWAVLHALARSERSEPGVIPVM